MPGPEPLGLPRRVERVADEDERRDFQPFGHGHGAHPAAHRPAAHRDRGGRHPQSFGQPRRGRPHHVDADLRRIGSTEPGRPSREIDPLDGQTPTGHRRVDGHERRLVPAGTGPRGQQQSRDAPRVHRSIPAGDTVTANPQRHRPRQLRTPLELPSTTPIRPGFPRERERPSVVMPIARRPPRCRGWGPPGRATTASTSWPSPAAP